MPAPPTHRHGRRRAPPAVRRRLGRVKQPQRRRNPRLVDKCPAADRPAGHEGWALRSLAVWVASHSGLELFKRLRHPELQISSPAHAKHRRSSADRLIWRSRERTCFMRPSCPAGASRRAASFCATLTCDVLLSISRCFNRTGEMLLRRSIAPPTARGRRERMREEKEEWREMREER